MRASKCYELAQEAPEAKIQEEKDKLAKYEQMMAQVEERLAQMKQNRSDSNSKVPCLVIKKDQKVCGIGKQKDYLTKISRFIREKILQNKK